MSPSDSKLPAPPPGLTGKYLTFALGNESYGIPVLKVREIIRPPPITLVPQMPTYILGVVNLRGKIIPVYDLRARFGLSGVAPSERTCIVVAQLTTGPACLQAGFVVDQVEEVLTIAPSEIEPPPDFGGRLERSYILGIAKTQGSVKILLDIDGVAGTVAAVTSAPEPDPEIASTVMLAP